MTDFFTRLAQRTLGQVIMIQPFIPSAFASGFTLVSTGQTSLDQEAAGQRAGEGKEALFGHDLAPPQPPTDFVSEGKPAGLPNGLQRKTVERGLHGPAAPVSQDVRQPSLRSKTDTGPVSRRSTEAGPREPIEVMASGGGEGFEAPETSFPVSRLIRPAEQPAGEPLRGNFPPVVVPVARDAHGRNPLPEPSSDYLENVSGSQPTAKGGSPEQSQIPERQPSTTPPRESSPPWRIRPEAATLRERASLTPEEHAMVFPEAPPSPPVIRVTIGRVEVRASLPPTSPQPLSSKVRPGAALSLDDYLKRRNEGQR
jgi:hypothetical protein